MPLTFILPTTTRRVVGGGLGNLSHFANRRVGWCGGRREGGGDFLSQFFFKKLCKTQSMNFASTT